MTQQQSGPHIVEVDVNENMQVQQFVLEGRTYRVKFELEGMVH